MYEVTVEKIKRRGMVKWIGRIDGKETCEARTKRDAIKWSNQHVDWLRKQEGK